MSTGEYHVSMLQGKVIVPHASMVGFFVVGITISVWRVDAGESYQIFSLSLDWALVFNLPNVNTGFWHVDNFCASPSAFLNDNLQAM